MPFFNRLLGGRLQPVSQPAGSVENDPFASDFAWSGTADAALQKPRVRIQAN
jgi:hypothetical protein